MLQPSSEVMSRLLGRFDIIEGTQAMSYLHTDLFTDSGSVSDAYEVLLRDQKRYLRMAIIFSIIGLGALICAVEYRSLPWLFAVSAVSFWASLLAKHDESNCNYMMHMIDYHRFMRSHPDGG